VDELVALADAGVMGLVAHGVRDGLMRGYLYQGGVFQSDRAAEQVTVNDLVFGAGPGQELTFTGVVAGTGTRIGIDRDEDGHFDRDELDAFSDPADAASEPGAWQDRFHSLAGTAGVEPRLFPTGALAAGTPITLTLSDALSGAAAYFVVGLSELNATFEGGVLVPNPDIFVVLFVGAGGGLAIADTWPAGVPSGFSMYLQYWIQDGGGPTGWSASNAIQGTTP
jgi:hypothetical protein